jgi:sulfur-carrier protein
MPRVRIPTPLLSYTNATWVQATGDTVAEVMADLDRAYPGLRFRVIDEQNAIRKHMRIFLNNDIADDLETPVTEADEVTLMQALSGG